MLVHYDISGKFGSGRYNCECPLVVKRGGYYYLFRTEYYPTGRTHVFRSDNPFNFGIGTDYASKEYVCNIKTAAPEIIVDNNTGKEYITSNHDLTGGTQICKLNWIDD